MSFRRENDKLAKLNSKKFSIFRGSHYGTGKCDQYDPYAYVSDFTFMNEKMELRDGKRKSQATGYPATITSMFNVSVGGENLLGVVVNGVLNVYPVSDVMAAIRKYYTVREVRAGFTPSRLTAKTVNELITGRPI